MEEELLREGVSSDYTVDTCAAIMPQVTCMTTHTFTLNGAYRSGVPTQGITNSRKKQRRRGYTTFEF